MMNPDPYRGLFGNDGAAYAAQVKEHIQFATPGKIAGFFHETIQGVGGSVPLADGFLPEVYKVCCPPGKNQNALLPGTTPAWWHLYR